MLMRRDFLHDEDGATAIEYGLFLALIGVVLVTAASQLGTDLGALFQNVASHFGTATP